ncbi:aminotransferase class V-fold PLP-dependent enzyme [Mangrovivirga sp. M17]|uniref:Aminotransferase class V-fold PLP-dependent enzyme n=1 Tax=Mangrovivirga halotolerans TaxID=2993936 RepID=A0ABT3RQQ2_9BACT|nr:aminotransferase class V-fold PLP-dependent enzyme [Mangrovivirga halotolerans]MCX2743940.1 aminotransferase class V-fold PLP-dependent enzyme [Mangrovivirga halotolerans]
MSPLLVSTQQAGIQGIKSKGDPTKINPEDFFTIKEHIKKLYSELVNCNQEQIALIPSSSYGYASVFQNLKANKGDEIIMVTDEFPSSYYTINKWCNNTGANLIEISKPSRESEMTWSEKLIESINENTSIIAIPTVHWIDGTAFDLKQIGKACRKNNIKLIVDGTQSVGAVPIDITECNIFALIVASYKWLFGPYSIGLLYIDKSLNTGDPIEYSWMNRSNAADFSSLTNYTDEYGEGASRYNVGEFSNFILLPMLKDALEQLSNWTVEGVNNYCAELSRDLIEFCKSNGLKINDSRERENHLISIDLSESSITADEIVKELKKENISVSVRKTLIRISINVYNTPEDISKFISAVKRLI